MISTPILVAADIPILKFNCPIDAESIELETYKNHIYDLTSIPQCVKHLQFGKYFNQQIEKGDLPSELQSIIFAENFNQKIEKNVLPAGL